MSDTHDTAAILSIGDELVLGQTVDTNSAWISRMLSDRGIRIRTHATVPDKMTEIAAHIRMFASNSDLVIVTGGLGPTEDDLTRQALAEVLDEDLVCDESVLERIRNRFRSVHMEMPESNRVQACHPKSARLLPNELGTAPGLHARIKGTDIFCLPGPPNEMHPMFEAHVLPILRTNRVVLTHIVRTVGIAESTVADRLGEMMDRSRNPLVGTTASTDSVSIRIRYEGQDLALGERLVDETVGQVRSLLGPFVFGEGEQNLPGVVVDLLRASGDKLATVESCTGGLIAKLITDVPGASDVFHGGWVTYSNAFKAEQVGVDPAVFDRSGAVSEPCCRQMAEGGLVRSRADHALSVTGIAGPGGGSADKPVGTVWIGLARTGRPTQTRLFRFNGDRDAIRLRSAMTALALLRLSLIGDEDTALACQAPG
ncbi:MAG TPA: competence/damage-inducible protein A [Phycisphaerales bacterium]|nr:competence/damage-inducible protein A [Phycisphaerales bacterium]